jgi:hypothetical protein
VLKPGGRLVVWSPNRFMLTTDPHLGLWGVGWIPRRWTRAYTRLRRRAEWAPELLSAREAERLAVSSGFVRPRIAPPEVSARWARTRSRSERLMIGAYGVARRFEPTRRLLTAVGPLWELVAAKDSGAAA